MEVESGGELVEAIRVVDDLSVAAPECEFEPIGARRAGQFGDEETVVVDLLHCYAKGATQHAGGGGLRQEGADGPVLPAGVRSQDRERVGMAAAHYGI